MASFAAGAAVISSGTLRRQPRLFAFYGVIGFAFLVLVGQLWNVQIANGLAYRERAEVNRVRVVSEKPRRGVIYDRAGRQVARNVPSFTVGVRAADLPRDASQQAILFERLARLLEMPVADVRTAAQAGKQDPFTPARIKSPVARDVALILEEQSSLLPGVVVDFTPIRSYPEGAVLGQVLGYTGPIPSGQLQARIAAGYERDDTVGLTGVEAAFEDEVKGSLGRKQVEVDAMGRVTNVLQTLTPTITGGNIVLTIDSALQRRATEALAAAMAKSGSPQAALVAVQPATGEILASVSLPNYDNNLFAAGISAAEYRRLSEDPWRPLVNNAVAGQYPPGSTFKMVTAAAALQERVVTSQTRFNCAGSLTVQGRRFNDWTPQGHGPNVALRNAIASSCDIYFYSLAGGNPYTNFKGLGIQKLAEYARAFGFGERSGVRLPGEVAGLVPTEEWKRERKKESWYIGDNFNVGIGQGDLLATPLQLANMTAAIANGGTLYRPLLVRAVRDAEGNVTQTFGAETIRKLPVSPEHMAAIRAGMLDVVASSEGTAHWALRQAGIPIAGKTGTAEFAGPLDSKGNLPTHALFVGYAPYDNPQIAVAVVVYDGGEGSEVAAPAAADVMKAYLELGGR